MRFRVSSQPIGAAAFALLAASVAYGAAAQTAPAETPDQAEFLPRINATSIAPALSAVTDSHFVGERPDGTTMLVATAPNGLRFEISLRACTEESETQAAGQPRHCRGILMLSAWDPAPEIGLDRFDDAVDSFLIQNPAVNAGKTGDRAPYIARYVIADHGTAQGNLIAEFANFIRSAAEFQNTIAPIYSE